MTSQLLILCSNGLQGLVFSITGFLGTLALVLTGNVTLKASFSVLMK